MITMVPFSLFVTSLGVVCVLGVSLMWRTTFSAYFPEKSGICYWVTPRKVFTVYIQVTLSLADGQLKLFFALNTTSINSQNVADFLRMVWVLKVIQQMVLLRTYFEVVVYRYSGTVLLYDISNEIRG